VLPQPDALPPNLPDPVDDGAARHLPGKSLPPLTFSATDGSRVQLDRVATGRWILFVYPSTGKPGEPIPAGWNEIPGARGCSQEACSFRDNLAALSSRGVEKVLALSSDPTAEQQALVVRFHIPYPLLSDPELSLAAALDLPTFSARSRRFYRRLTMIIRGARIEQVFYPIFPPDTHVDEILGWLAAHPLAPSESQSR
jgi:peroxiredoxin